MAIQFQPAADWVNQVADTWLLAMQAALVQGCLALGIVAVFWRACRRQMSHAFAHGLFLMVPLKTVSAALFVAWPVVISFSIPVPNILMNTVKPAMHAPAVPPTAAAWPSEMSTIGPLVEPTPAATAQPGLEPTSFQASASAMTTAAWAMIAWAGISLILFLTFFVKSWRARQRFANSRMFVKQSDQEMVHRLALQLKLHRIPQIWETPEVAGPAVVGLIRPRLLVPEGFFADFNQDEMKWALMHELSHLRRCDLMWVALERGVSICFFFHPAVWLARKATSTFRELACDEAAMLHSGLSPRLCALGFLKIVEQASRKANDSLVILPELSLSSRFNIVQRRIMNMTKYHPSGRPTGLSRGALLWISAAALLAILPFSPRLVAQTPAGAGAKSNDLLEFGGRVVDNASRPVADAHVQLILFDDARTGRPTELPAVRTDALGQWHISGIPPKFDQAGVAVTHPKYAQVITGIKIGDQAYQQLIQKTQVIEVEPGIKLSGKLFNSDGRPAVGLVVADVSVPFFESPYTKTMTNQRGEFTFENLRTKTFSLLKAHDETQGVATFAINNEDGRAQTKTVSLEKAASLKIIMLDTAGKPLPNVEVTVSQIYNDGHRQRLWTDESGVVNFQGLPVSKNIRVMSLVPGFVGIIEELSLQERMEKTYRLLPGVRATGRVRDKSTNQPIAEFRVKYQSTIENPQGIKLGQTFDSARGVFSAPPMNLSMEQYDIEITADGYRGFKSKKYRTADGPVSLDVLLEPVPADELPRYQGKVVMADGRPVGNIKIGVVSPKDEPLLDNGKIQKTRKNRLIPMTNAAGEFDFQWLEAATELLVLHESGAKRLLIKPGMDLKQLEIRLEPYGRLVVSLARDGKPDLNSRMWLYRSSAAQSFIGSSVEGKRRADGKVEFEKLVPGLVTLTFDLTGIPLNNWPSTSLSVQIPAGETVVIDHEMKRPAGPLRVVTGKLKFANKPQSLDASKSLMMLLAPEGNPLRSTVPEELAFNSEKKTKYRQTPEGRRLFDTLEGFRLLEKEISRDGDFRFSVPAGKYELRIHVGSRNTLYGNAIAALDIPELKPGEPDQSIDIGFVEVLNAYAQKDDTAANKAIIVTPSPAARKK